MAHHTFEAKVEYRRKDKGLTPEQIDERLGEPAGTCQAWEEGRLAKPKPHTIALLADILDCVPSVLDRDFDRLLDGHTKGYSEAIDQLKQEGRLYPGEPERIWNQVLAQPGFRGGLSKDQWLDQVKKIPPKLL